MKGLLAMSFAALAATSLSVFDLQKVSRFSSSGLVDCAFTHAIPKPDGGFIAAGTAAQDIVIVDFDRFGGVVKTALWDSPRVIPDDVHFLGRYADGKILFSTGLGADTRLVQLSPNLTVNWEVSRNVNNPKAALDGSGNAYLAHSGGLEAFGVNGVSKGTATVTNFEARAAVGFPGTTNKGLMIVGRQTFAQQPRALRFSDTAVLVYDRTDTLAAAGTGSSYSCVDAESDGDAIAAGSIGNFGSSVGIFTSLTGAGVGVSSAESGGISFVAARIRSATQAYATLTGSSGERLCLVARSTGATIASSSVYANGLGGFAELSGLSRVIASGDDDASYYLTSNTLVQSSLATKGGYRSVEALSDSVAVGARGRNGVAEVGYFDGNANVAAVGYRFAGAPSRSLVLSRPLPDASVAMIGVEYGGDFTKCLAIRYNSAGNLIYAKTLNFANESVGMSRFVMTTFPDGSIATAVRLAGNSWGFARVSNTGVVKAVAHPFFGDNFQPAEMVALADGSTAFFWTGENSRLNYTRLSSTGAIMAQYAYADLSGYGFDGIAPPVFLASGNILIAAVMSDNTVKIRAINPNTGAAGSIITVDSNAQAVRVDKDASGNIVIAYDSMGGLKLERRSGTNLATILAGATAGLTQKLIDMKVAPNGNIVALCQQTGDDQIRIFAPNFAPIVSGALPATVTSSVDLDVDANNVAYVGGIETVGSTQNAYAARYLASGIRSAQRRTAAKNLVGVHVAGAGVWVTGSVGTRKKGDGPFAARYSL